MAHSAVPHAGQRYGSARKRGVRGDALERLRSAVFNRKGGGRGLTPDDREEINSSIEEANQRHQANHPSLRRYSISW